MTAAPRFWPLATCILLPVLVLAGVAAFGLYERRQAVENAARVEGEKLARRMETLWGEMLRGEAGEKRAALYPSESVPQAPGPEAVRLDKAVAGKEGDTLRALRSIPDGQPLTASGMPVRVLAAWHLWQSTQQPEDAAALARLATGRDAGVLTEGLLQKLSEAGPAAVGDMAPWLRLWRILERRRAFLKGLEPWRVEGLVFDAGGSPAFVSGVKNGEGGVLLVEDLRTLFERMVEVLRNETPPWAELSIKAGSWALHPLAKGEAAGFRMWEDFQLLAGIRDEKLLFADYQQMVRWVSLLTGSALLTAILGLWLVRRTLLRERKLGEMKSQFVSSVSHELRAPVGSMRLMAEALASGKVSGPPADEFHRLMASEGARLSGLIENVLDFARIEQGRKWYAFAETDVGALVRDAVKLMTPQAEERGQKILIVLQRLPFVPQVDAPALQQALINLLDNALKFSPPDTEVNVALSDGPSRNEWSLAVTDYGAGVPKAEHTRIFERFYRPGNELRRETTGTGIGLAIVKHVVEGHGGRVKVDSEPGKGSVFTMVFPALNAHPES